MADHLSKYVWAVALKTRGAEEVVAAIVNAVWREHGAPTAVLSDNAMEFKGVLFTSIKER